MDDALAPAAKEQLLDLLRAALAATGPNARSAAVAVEAGDQLRAIPVSAP